MKRASLLILILLGFSGASSDNKEVIQKPITVVKYTENSNIDNLMVKAAELDSLLLELKKYKR